MELVGPQVGTGKVQKVEVCQRKADHANTDGSLLGVPGRWRSVVQLDDESRWKAWVYTSVLKSPGRATVWHSG